MKSKTFLAALVCCLCLGFATEAAAASWRVNNDKRANANFLDLNAAMGNVSNGDTLYVDKATTFSTVQTLNKAVTVIGPGYFIGENDADEAYFSNTVNIEAEGVKLTGLHLSGVNIRHDKAIIERCRVTGNILANDENYAPCKCSIRSSFITGQILGSYDSTSDWEFLNNIFYLYYSTLEEVSCIDFFTEAIIDHNTFYVNRQDWYPAAIGQNIGYTKIMNNLVYQGYEKAMEYNILCTDPELHNNISGNVLNYALFGEGMDEIYPDNTILENASLNSFFDCNGGNPQRDVYYQYSVTTGTSVVSEGTTVIVDVDAPVIVVPGAETGEITHFSRRRVASTIYNDKKGVFYGAYPYVMSGYPLYVPRFESVNVPSQPDANGNLRVNLVIKNQNK